MRGRNEIVLDGTGCDPPFAKNRYATGWKSALQSIEPHSIIVCRGERLNGLDVDRSASMICINEATLFPSDLWEDCDKEENRGTSASRGQEIERFPL